MQLRLRRDSHRLGGSSEYLESMNAPAFQFYADDFLSGTIQFTDAEVGIYIRLLCVQWNCGSLPNDPAELLSYGKNNDGSAIGKVMAKFRVCEDGRLRNARMEEVRDQQVRFRVERSNSGSKGAKSRWLSHNSAIQQPMAKHGTPTPTPTPVQGPPLSPTLFEVQTTEKPVTLDKLQIRLGKLFGRRDTTVWKVDEIKAYKKIGKVDEDDLRALESMYYEKLPSGAPDYRRTTLITLLNNFSGELDKARNFKPQTCI